MKQGAKINEILLKLSEKLVSMEVISFARLLLTLRQIAGPYVRFCYIWSEETQTWTFEAMYVCLRDIISDHQIYNDQKVVVDFRKEPRKEGLDEGSPEIANINEWFAESVCPRTRVVRMFQASDRPKIDVVIKHGPA